MSLHNRRKSRENYGTAGPGRSEMIMELPDEDSLENNTWIWSHTVAVGKRSFVDYKQSYQIMAPPPKYLEG
jgi:hypothetical protein